MDLENFNSADICRLVMNGRISAKVVNDELRYHLDDLDAHDNLLELVTAARCTDHLIQEALQEYAETRGFTDEPINVDLHTSMLSDHNFIECAIDVVKSRTLNIAFKFFGTDSSMSNQIPRLVKKHIDLLADHKMLVSDEKLIGITA